MYSNNFGGLLAVLGGFLFVIISFAITLFVIFIIGLVKVFQKNGRAGWEAIIPFYNSWVLVEISGLAWWWFLIINAGLVVSILDIEGLTSLAGLVTLFGNFCCFYNLRSFSASYKFIQETLLFLQSKKICFSFK